MLTLQEQGGPFSLKVHTVCGTAHPRGCGAERDAVARHASEQGSSPQVRGRPPAPCPRAVSPRLIPVGAGQTPRTAEDTSQPRAHPRGCGADKGPKDNATELWGSSPQVRGRLRRRRRRRLGPGLIPAGAGQTRTRCHCDTTARAHPRRCGADAIRAVEGFSAAGSSPQVRGRHRAIRRRDRGAGLIPAGAGQTCASTKVGSHVAALPRRCGADYRPAARRFRDWGSSPQVRGRHNASAGHASEDGLIPAGAGQTGARISFR